MIPDNYLKLKIAFQKYLGLADYTSPENTQDKSIRYRFTKDGVFDEHKYQMYIEELQHLASFIWGEAGGEDTFVMTPELLAAMHANGKVEKGIMDGLLADGGDPQFMEALERGDHLDTSILPI